MNYREISSPETLAEAWQAAQDSSRGALIFKHSTRCMTSSMVWKRFMREWSLSEEELPVYYLDLVRHRGLSDEIAQRTGVVHQSPQLLWLRKGNCIYHASHHNIDPEKISRQAAEY